jgi:TIR domain
MADIFISYERLDRARAQRVAEALEQHGWSVWWDRKLLAGDPFDKTIQQALDVARCVIVLWSKTSVSSGWVKDEASEGAKRSIQF